MTDIHGTTVLAVRRGNLTVLAADGQVSMGRVVLKHTARKIRTLLDGKVLAGFAGSTADAITLFEKFEAKLKEFSGSLTRSAVELAKDWRTDRILRRLEAMLLVADRERMLLVSGTGDVVEPERGLLAIGSGGNFAHAAARAYLETSSFTAAEIAERALRVAAEMCIYTNLNITVESLE